MHLGDKHHSQYGLENHGLTELGDVYWTLPTAALYEQALKRDEGLLSSHGPLVVRHARELGLQSYRQVPREQNLLGDTLRELGFGKGAAPAVFAELVMGMPPLNAAGLRAWRSASREIEADEKRHIDFSRSMLLFA